MKNPQKVNPLPLDVREKEENQGKQNKAKPKKKTLQEQLAEINAPPEEEKPKPTKWYMGDYAHNDGTLIGGGGGGGRGGRGGEWGRGVCDRDNQKYMGDNAKNDGMLSG